MTLQVNVEGHLPDAQQDAIERDWVALYDRVCQELSLQGLDMTVPPQAIPFPDVTPDDLVHLEGEAYAEKMAQVTYWQARVKMLLAWVTSEIICFTGEYNDIVREMRTKLRKAPQQTAPRRSGAPTLTELKEEAERQELPRRIKQRLVHLEAKKSVLERYGESLEHLWTGISRQVTFRGQETYLQGADARRGHPGNFSR